MRTLNRWKVAFFSVLLLSISTTAFLGYGFIDMAYTITYMRDGYDGTIRDLERLSKIYPKETYNKKDILHLLRQNNKDGFIIETNCTIQLDGLRFEFNKKDELISVNARAEYESESPCPST